MIAFQQFLPHDYFRSAASFDTFDYLTFTVPGAILLVGLMILFPWIRKQFEFDKKQIVDFSAIGLFVVIAFVALNRYRGGKQTGDI